MRKGSQRARPLQRESPASIPTEPAPPSSPDRTRSRTRAPRHLLIILPHLPRSSGVWVTLVTLSGLQHVAGEGKVS